MIVTVNDFGIEWERKGVTHKVDFDDLIKAYEKQIPKKMTNEEFFLAFRNELDSMIASDILRISTVKEIFEENKKVGILILQNNNTYIDGLYILPEYRRKGLGRKAVADFVKENGLPEELHIIKKNYVARLFWESIFELEKIALNEIDVLYRIKRIKTFNDLGVEE